MRRSGQLARVRAQLLHLVKDLDTPTLMGRTQPQHTLPQRTITLCLLGASPLTVALGLLFGAPLRPNLLPFLLHFRRACCAGIDVIMPRCRRTTGRPATVMSAKMLQAVFGVVFDQIERLDTLAARYLRAKRRQQVVISVEMTLHVIDGRPVFGRHPAKPGFPPRRAVTREPQRLVIVRNARSGRHLSGLGVTEQGGPPLACSSLGTDERAFQIALGCLQFIGVELKPVGELHQQPTIEVTAARRDPGRLAAGPRLPAQFGCLLGDCHCRSPVTIPTSTTGCGCSRSLSVAPSHAAQHSKMTSAIITTSVSASRITSRSMSLHPRW